MYMHVYGCTHNSKYMYMYCIVSILHESLHVLLPQTKISIDRTLTLYTYLTPLVLTSIQ